MCNCIKTMDEKLAEHNGRLAQTLVLKKDLSELTSRLCVATEKIDSKKRKKIPVVMASFCPFCGESLMTPNA